MTPPAPFWLTRVAHSMGLKRRAKLGTVVGCVVFLTSAALGQSSLPVGTPVSSWNGYLVADLRYNIQGSTMAPILGSAKPERCSWKHVHSRPTGLIRFSSSDRSRGC
jgi:hypothetical protein